MTDRRTGRPDDGAVLGLVYQWFRDHGGPPSPGQIAAALDVPIGTALNALYRLARANAVVLGESGDWIRMAHPFSSLPMGFVVRPADPADERAWWGGCAWDSLGLGAALAMDVEVMTRCPGCGTPLAVDAGPDRSPGRDAVVRFPRPAREWWADAVDTCSNIRLFCSPDHVRDWADRAGLDQAARGEVVPLDTVWRLAQPWYGDRLAPDYRPRARDHEQQILSEAGLTGPFWTLP